MTGKEPPLVRPDDARYVVEEEVAAGGMGVIYRVLDRSLGRTVAMKVCARRTPGAGEESPGGAVFPPRSPQGDGARARFLAEAQVTAQLDHPGIVPVHELGIAAGDQLYFTMPLVKGRSLSEVFALARTGGEGWNLSRAAAALIKVCQAVAYAHDKGIVHRDLKPANVMVGRYGEVYVLDWGLAKVRGQKDGDDGGRPAPSGGAPPGATAWIASDSSLATEVGAVLGTPAYMSPEQAAGGAAVDERSDVYALGAMLYELLSGQAPHVPPAARITPQALVACILAGPPPPVRTLDPAAPAELVAICERAMAREPGRRYPQALALAEDLQAYLDHRVVAAYRTGMLAELRSWCYRHRTLLRVTALVAVGSAIAFLALGWVLRNREAERLLVQAREHLARHQALKEEVPRLEKAWLEARMAERSWAPAWQRTDEIDKHRALASARREADATFSSAQLELANAMRVAPPWGVGGQARGHLRDLYLGRHQDLVKGETVVLSPEYYGERLRDLDPAAHERAIEAPGRIAIASMPPGAEVYCFRYEEGEDTRLLPRPFDPAARRPLGEPFLLVARIWDAAQHQGVFSAGDRLLAVGGQPVRTEADLARVIAAVERGGKVAVQLERRGSVLDREWVPWPRETTSLLTPGVLMVVHEQMGLSFAGYPLDVSAGCRLGETREGEPVMVELPRGSYLLVLRKHGYRDTRFPVVIPWREGVEKVRLLAEQDIPPGFDYIPAGPFSYGGDPLAFQSLERGETDLHEFFIARFEVTVAEYVEFLNDPEVRARTDAKGEAAPFSESVRQELATHDGEKLGLVPAQTRVRLFLTRATDQTWAIDPDFASNIKPSSPVSGISQLAAREYAHWRSTRDGRWRYRLPEDLEWEKAARGVDRRTHVWGEYLVWAFCWSAGGLWSPHLPTATGVFSADESVYGVRDLAGSVEEYTQSRILGRYTTRRGGNWSVSDSQSLRVATRNGRLSTGRGTETGFRLVAEMRE
jgi:serine/threonine protein kinase/formylglycine-generating enzyme required for sulfatase activity